MLKKAALTLVLSLLAGFTLHAQTLSGFILDMGTQEPIPYATIQIGSSYGTIANEEGGFTLVLQGQAQDSLLISSMGYAQKSIPKPTGAKEIVIFLEPSAIELDEVFLSNRQLTADEIIREVRIAYPGNYLGAEQKYEVFYRGTSYMQFDDLSLAIEKASGISKKQVGLASKRLDSLARAIIEGNLIEFRDYSGTVFVRDSDSSKVSVDKATKLLDSRKDFSMDGVQRQAQNIILQYLDTSQTYKLKSGLFKVEDSLSFDEEDFRPDQKSEFSIGEIRSSILSTLKLSRWHELSFLDKLLDPDSYRFTLEGTSYFQGNPIYVVSFFPRKGSSKYTGRLYVSARDFAVLKADYTYGEGKRGRKFNMKLLLGIKYIENRNKGTVLYKATENGKYCPYYVTRESGNYIYLHRPLKFIENSTRRNKVLFDFSLEGEGREKQELLILSAQDLKPGEFKEFKEVDKVPFTLLKRFEPSIWQDRQIIQPLEEMKNFRVTENED